MINGRKPSLYLNPTSNTPRSTLSLWSQKKKWSTRFESTENTAHYSWSKTIPHSFLELQITIGSRHSEEFMVDIASEKWTKLFIGGSCNYLNGASPKRFEPEVPFHKNKKEKDTAVRTYTSRTTTSTKNGVDGLKAKPINIAGSVAQETGINNAHQPLRFKSWRRRIVKIIIGRKNSPIKKRYSLYGAAKIFLYAIINKLKIAAVINK